MKHIKKKKNPNSGKFKITFSLMAVYCLLMIGSILFYGRTESEIINILDPVPVNNTLISLENNTNLSQEFVPQYSNLNYIELILVNLPEDTDGTIYFTLYDSANKICCESSLSTTDIIPGEYCRIPVAARIQKGKSYTLSISCDASAGSPKLVSVTSDLALNENGKLFIDAKPSDFSLATAYIYSQFTCSAALIKEHLFSLSIIGFVCFMALAVLLSSLWIVSLRNSFLYSVRQMKIKAGEFLTVIAIFLIFTIAALINGGSADSSLKNKLISLFLFLLPFVGICTFTFQSIIVYLRQLLIYFLRRKQLIGLLVITTIPRLFMLRTMPRWDGGEYYYRLGTACKNYCFTFKSFFDNFRLCSHGTLGFSLVMSIGEFLNPRGVIGCLIVTLILTLLAFICIYNILEHIFTEKQAAAFFITLTVSMIPLFFGTFSYVNVDYIMALFFIFTICSHINQKYFLTFLWACMTMQTKETGIVLIAGYLIFYLVLIFVKAQGIFLHKILKTLSHPESAVSILCFLFFLFNIYWQGDIVTWSRGTHEEWLPQTTDYFGINTGYIINKLKQILILNFNWIITLILIFLIIYIIITKKKGRFAHNTKESAIYSGILGGMIFYILFNLFYVTASLYRYLVVLILFMVLAVLTLMWKVFSRRMSIALSLVICILFAIQTFHDADPVSNLFFLTVDTGKGKKIFTDYNTSYYGDGLINNYSYTWIDNLYDQMLRDINYTEDITIFLPGTENAGSHINGNGDIYKVVWNTEKQKRVIADDTPTESNQQIVTLSTDNLLGKLPYAYKESEIIKNNTLPKKGVIFFLPHYQEDENNIIDCLSRYYYIGERKKKKNPTGEIIYYELLIKDSFNGLSIQDFVPDRDCNRICGNTDTLENYYYRYYPAENVVSKTVTEIGDVIDISCYGFMDGDKLPTQLLGSYADNYYEITIGSNTLLPEIEQALIGQNVGDTIYITTIIPDNYPVLRQYAQTEITFEITILHISGHKNIFDGNDEISAPIFEKYEAVMQQEAELMKEQYIINCSMQLSDKEKEELLTDSEQLDVLFHETFNNYLSSLDISFEDWLSHYFKDENAAFYRAKEFLLSGIMLAEQ